MSNYPSDFDDDSTLPAVNDNLTEIGGDAINALRDAVMQIELALGLNIAGTQPNLAARLGVFINPDGSPNASVLTSLGLVTLPIRNDQIAENAGIPESKLRLDFRTQDLFNYIRDLSLDVNTVAGWISISGIKLEPHLIGAIYRHTMDQIDVAISPSQFLQNNLRLLRDNTNSYTLVADINSELLAHQWADGSPFGTLNTIVTNNGSVYSTYFAHTASGIFINPSRFTHIPQTNDNLQLFADYVDENIINQQITLQNINSNGISRVSRSSSLLADGYGQSLIPVTPVIAYLKNIGNNSSPFDDINTGDDIIEFKPATADIVSNSFDEKFALVRPGDIIRINYGDGYNIEVPFVIKEKKYIQSGGNKKYIVRIAGKNLFYSPNSIARIDKSLANNDKYGVLSIAPANNSFSATPSLIVGGPRSAQALGVGFSPDEFDESHYLLYLALFPTGQPQDGYTFLPAIDVTGNAGTTPGLYTLDSIVQATNASLRKSGFNYRFTAYSFEGEFGIMLADSYNNAGFSIVNGVVSPLGVFDQSATIFSFPNNVIDLFPTSGNTVAPDPLGLGARGAGIASPPYVATYGSAEASQLPTILLVPLKRNNYYVDGTELEKLSLDVGQALDQYGDGYWVGTIHNITVFPGVNGHVQTTYRVPLDLSTSGLKVGKTLVVQSLGAGSLVDFGRFIINNISFDCFPAAFTDITVYDAVHAVGTSPSTTLDIGNQVAIYFSPDSVSFNSESSTDFVSVTPFKRHFEVYVDSDAKTFTHERGRIFVGASNTTVDGVTIYSTSELAKLDLVKISSKLRGYQFGPVNKITLNLSYDSSNDTYSGYLASYDGIIFTHQGATVTGRKGEVTRFYDETNVDYVEIIFDTSLAISTFTNQVIDIQLFPTLSLDEEIMMIGTCQLNDLTETVSRVRDERQFGNTSEKDISSSLFDFMASPERMLHINGVIRGFDIVSVNAGLITFSGGVALVNGKFQYLNEQSFFVPKVKEYYSSLYYSINWALCCNSGGELVLIPLTDYDPAVAVVPNFPGRMVTLSNAVTGNTYQVDSSTFTNILNNRKDLTMLYIVTSTVTGGGSGATVAVVNRDIRRFINDQDANIPAVVSNSSSQNNFRTFDSAATWVRLNNTLQNTIQIKGNATATVDPRFNQVGVNNTADVDITGDSRATLTFNTSVTMSNVNFRNLAITFNAAAVLTNVNFTNCTVTVNLNGLNATGGVFSNTPFSIVGNTILNGTTVNACTIATTSGSLSFSNVTYTGTSLSASSFSATGSNISGCSITTSGSVSLTNTHYVGPSLSGTTFSTNTSTVSDCTITASNTTTFTSSTFIRCNITSGSTGNYNSVNMSYTNTTISTGNLTAVNINVDIGSLILSAGNITVSGAGSFFNRSTVSISGTSTLTNVRFSDCIITFGGIGTFTNVIIDPSTVTIGALITTVSPFSMVDCTVQVNTAQAFLVSNNFRFERNIVTYTGAPGGAYTTGNLVNASSGMIYGNVTSNLSDIFVRDNSFTSSMSDRFAYVTLALPSTASVLQNVDISKNKFISTAATDDLRAVIAVVSTTTTPPVSYPSFARLSNVFIEGNMCNANQMIVITGTRVNGAAYQFGEMPSCVNTRISNNVCGAIGYITAADQISTFNNGAAGNNGFIGDKQDQLVISGNSCKIITNLDHIGDYIPFRATAFPSNNIDWVTTGTGAVSIINNSVNWIQVGASSYVAPYDGVIIAHNRVSPTDPTFLSNYTDTFTSGVTPSNVGILLRREYNLTGNTRSVISGNIITQNAKAISVGVTSTFYYDAAIVCMNSANVMGNSVIGVLNSSSAPMLFLWSSGNVLVSGNNFDRAGLTIQAYVTGQAGAGNQVSITNNIFDSQFTDAANTIEQAGLNIPSAWSFHNNRNQIFYKEITLFDEATAMSSLFGGGADSQTVGFQPQYTVTYDPQAFGDTFVEVARAYNPFSDAQNTNHFIGLLNFDDTYSHTTGWTKRGSLDDRLPANVQILSAKIGYTENSDAGKNVLDHTHNYIGTTWQWNGLTLTIYKYLDTTTSNDAVNGVLNIRNQVTLPTLSGGYGADLSESDKVRASHYIAEDADETFIRFNTVYVTADLTGHDFTTGKNYHITWTLDVSMKKATSAETGHHVMFYFSPIVLKCIYR